MGFTSGGFLSTRILATCRFISAIYTPKSGQASAPGRPADNPRRLAGIASPVRTSSCSASAAHFVRGDRRGKTMRRLGSDVPLSARVERVVGKTPAGEIDFVTNGANGIAYYQVAETVANPAALERELASLQSVRDNYPKYLITMDDVGSVSHDGIQQVYALGWLLEQDGRS